MVFCCLWKTTQYLVRKWTHLGLVLRLQKEDTSIFQVILILTTYYSDTIWRGSNHATVLLCATAWLLNQKRLPEEMITPSKLMLCKMALATFLKIRDWYINYVLWFSWNWYLSSLVTVTILSWKILTHSRETRKLKIKYFSLKTNLNLVPTLH